MDIPLLKHNTYLQQIYFLIFLFKTKCSMQFIQLALNGFKVFIELIQFFMCKPNCHIITNVFISFQSKLKHCLWNDLLCLSIRSSLKVQRPPDIFKLKAISNKIYYTYKKNSLLKLLMEECQEFCMTVLCLLMKLTATNNNNYQHSLFYTVIQLCPFCQRP